MYINKNKISSGKEGDVTYAIQPKGDNKILLIVLNMKTGESLSYEHECKFMTHGEEYDMIDTAEVGRFLENYIELLR